MSVVRYFDEDKAEDRFLPGVPSRDLTDEDWEQLAPHLQRSVDASGIWRKTKPRTEAKQEGDN